MIIEETEELNDLASSYVCSVDAIKKNDNVDWHLERIARVTEPLKDMLSSYALTEADPYNVNIDGDLYCNLWFEDGELKCGEFYYEA
jgi:hypothetical protein